MRETVSNQTLRKRFGLSDERAETVSRILRDMVDAGWIKQEDTESGSKKYARYFTLGLSYLGVNRRFPV